MPNEINKMDLSTLKTGLKVYHKKINQNLIVVNASHSGIVCLDARHTNSDCFGTMIVDAQDLQKGWKSSAEISIDRMKRLKGE